jgi:hypothetical protein
MIAIMMRTRNDQLCNEYNLAALQFSGHKILLTDGAVGTGIACDM